MNNLEILEIRQEIRHRMNLSEDILNDYTLNYYINQFYSLYGWSKEKLILNIIEKLKYYLCIK